MTLHNITALADYEEGRNGASADQAEPAPRSVVRRMSQVSSRTIRWAWKGRLALGYLTVETGEEGLGKSAFNAWLTARITRGELDGAAWSGTPVDVLIIAAEDGLEDTWKPRLTLAGADPERVSFLSLDQLGPHWNIRDGIDALRQAIEETGAKLVVFDSLLDNMPDGGGAENINSPTFVRAALAPLNRLVRDLGLVGLISLHPPKSRGVAFRDMVQASQAFSAIPRLGLLFAWHPDDAEDDLRRRRVLIRGKGNIGRNPGALEFRILGRQLLHDDGLIDEREVVDEVQPSDITIHRLVQARAGRDETGASKTDQAAEIIRTQLADGRWHPGAPIRDELYSRGLNSSSVVDAAKQLAGVHSRKAGGDAHGGWEWRIEADPSQESTDPPISIAMDSWPLNGANPQCSREESKNPSLLPTDSWSPEAIGAEYAPSCGHTSSLWRFAGAALWMCGECSVVPPGLSDIEWRQDV